MAKRFAHFANGFTLIELLIVVAIVAILSTVGASIYSNITGGVNDSRVKADVNAIAAAMEQQYNGTQYPAAVLGSYFSSGNPPQHPKGGNYNYEVTTPGYTSFRVCGGIGTGPALCTEPGGPDCYCKSSVREVFTGGGAGAPQCNDGEDNDFDGDTDLQDDGCADALDDNESDDPPPPSFDFSLVATSPTVTVTQGGSGNNTITATLISGSTTSVSFNASGLPSGANASFSPTSCNPTCSTNMTITTIGSTPTGTSTITVTGSGPPDRNTTFNLTVNPSGGGSCDPGSLTTGLVSYWGMNEASGATIGDMQGVNLGTATGTGVVPGKIGNSRFFNGTSDFINVNVAPGSSLDIDVVPVSISAWVKYSALGSARTVVGKGLTGTNGYALRITLTNLARVGTMGRGAQDSTGAIGTTNWHHLVGITRGANSSIYLDGVVTSGNVVDIDANDKNLLIGAVRNSSDLQNIQFFSGSIDEVGVWNKALTTGEVSALYNGGNGCVPGS